jgi:hydroxyethylthiazole kinase
VGSTPVDVYNALALVRESAPLIHNITNYVAMNSTANALLAVGASPAMVHAMEEVAEFASLSRALVVNIGTLSPRWVDAMHLAIAQARSANVPWVLDPVAVGATVYRSDVGASLAQLGPTVIRGNASEVMVLAGLQGSAGKGVDSAHRTDDALDSAQALARDTGAIVAMTGAVDYVTDGHRMVALRNGHALMARVTTLGCTCSALVGAFLGVAIDPFAATVAGVAVLGVAGEIAAEDAPGPGSLQLRLLDALYSLDESTLLQRLRVDELS